MNRVEQQLLEGGVQTTSLGCRCTVGPLFDVRRKAASLQQGGLAVQCSRRDSKTDAEG